MNKHTKRRKRRRANAIVRDGKNAVRAHRRKGGRTGHIMSKRTAAKRQPYRSQRPNPPEPTILNLRVAEI
jgi:hypothetical protein